jgi:hypothetical protein
MRIGSRSACDTCGRVESPNLQVFPHPTEANNHLCESCKQDLYILENISAVARNNAIKQ